MRIEKQFFTQEINLGFSVMKFNVTTISPTNTGVTKILSFIRTIVICEKFSRIIYLFDQIIISFESDYFKNAVIIIIIENVCVQ